MLNFKFYLNVIEAGFFPPFLSNYVNQCNEVLSDERGYNSLPLKSFIETVSKSMA